MRISIIGSGRVGLSLGALMAQAGLFVFMTDKDMEKKRAVEGDGLPFYEPGLPDLLAKNQERLEWTRYSKKILSADFIFFCLSAPLGKKGDLDLTETLNWARLIAESAEGEKFLVIKSAFPPGTAKKIQSIASKGKAKLSVISCPEFLRQGSALKDLAGPERLVIGSRDLKAGKRLEGLYEKFSKAKKIIHADPETAELAKLASASFLAVKVSFANEMAGLCELAQADPKKLRLILGSDKRIGEDFLTPGLGYGGYCLPKDVQMSLYEGKKGNQRMPLLRAAQAANSSLSEIFFQKIKGYFGGLKGAPLAFWGIGFKGRSDDLRNSPAFDLLCRLLSAGAELSVYDPLFVKERVFAFFKLKEACPAEAKGLFAARGFLGGKFQKDPVKFLRRKIFAGKVFFRESALESLKGRTGLIVGSDDEEFLKIPLLEIKKHLSRPFLADGRCLFSAEDLKNAGFDFYQRGFSPPFPRGKAPRLN